MGLSLLVMPKGALSLSQAETYYVEKYARDDYYSEDRTVAGEWFGIAAAALGLTGTAARADFTAVLRGLDPRTGVELVAKAQGREQRRAGWDATFSAPKSISIQALVGGDPRLIAAHRESVTAALGELETYAQARRRHGQEWVTTGNFAAVRFDHLAARLSRTAVKKAMRLIRSSIPMWSLPILADGLMAPGAVSNRSKFTARKAGRRRCTGRILPPASDNWATASKSPAGAASGSSPGTRAIKLWSFPTAARISSRNCGRRGLSGAAAAQNVAHSTRLAKDHRDEAELKTEWRERAAAIGLDLGQLGAMQRPAPNVAERPHTGSRGCDL